MKVIQQKLFPKTLLIKCLRDTNTAQAPRQDVWGVETSYNSTIKLAQP